MTFKTLIATAAVALAFAPSASAATSASAAPASAQQAKWHAYDKAAQTAYAPRAAEPSAAPVRRSVPTVAERDIPTGTRVVLAFVALAFFSTIVAVRRRDAMFRPASGGWDI